jgi:hypothetical protein
MKPIFSTKQKSPFPGPRQPSSPRPISNRSSRSRPNRGARGNAFAVSLVSAVSFAAAAIGVPERASAASLVPAFGTHKDERLGFTIQTPKDWTAVATAVDERWIVVKDLADKSSFWTDKSTGFTAEHKAEMQVIAFVSDAVKAKYKVTESEDKGKKETTIQFLNPYKDYKDFLTKRYTGGGWFVEKETQDKVGDVPVTIYDIRVDKSSNEGPKRISTWIYHVPDVDMAVQFECLESALPKLQNEFLRCFHSYKSIPRNGQPIAEAVTGGPVIKISDSAKLSPEDRKKERMIQEKRAHDEATKMVPQGWTAKRMGRFLVVSHADERFAKDVVEHCEAVWKWLDATFPYVGEKEYVRAPILRLCKGWEEFRSFVDTMKDDWTNIELVTFDEHEGAGGWGLEIICKQMFEHWIGDRDPELRGGLPYWVIFGMGSLMGQSDVKQDKLVFRNDDWLRDTMRETVREHKNVPARQLMTTEDDTFWRERVNQRQGGALVGYLMTGPGSKDKRTKDLLPTYIKNVQAVLAEFAAEDKKESEKDGKKEASTEEEEDAAVKSKGEARKQRLKKVVDAALDRTCKGWTADDWKRFEDSYLKSID